MTQIMWIDSPLHSALVTVAKVEAEFGQLLRQEFGTPLVQVVDGHPARLRTQSYTLLLYAEHGLVKLCLRTCILAGNWKGPRLKVISVRAVVGKRELIDVHMSEAYPLLTMTRCIKIGDSAA